MTDSLAAKDLTAGYGHKVVIDHQDISIAQGQITGLIGPNGSGKSTLFNVLNGFESPISGTVTLSGKPISRFSARQRAQQIACLPQRTVIPDGITVFELVSYGRYCRQRGFHHLSQTDRKAINDAIQAVHMTSKADELLTSLSGGQQQRALIAMTLAQDSRILMLDEPTTYLDLTNQLEILNLLQELNTKFRKTIIIVLHDLNEAARYCYRLVCLVDGHVKATGRPTDVITKAILADVFKVDGDILHDHGCPQIMNCHTLAMPS